jgi:hypothetical protein
MATRARRVRATLNPLSPILVLLPSLLLPLVSNGCAAAGVLTHKLMGPPPVPAQYKPAHEPMLVLVENYHNPTSTVIEGRRLENLINEQLVQYKIAPLTDPALLDEVRTQSGYEKLTIPAVGRACGAKQVLYVHVHKFSVEGTVGAEMLKGTADMSVRVVDAETGDNRWPLDAVGSPVTLETPWLRMAEGVNESTLREQMATRAADYIVKLFRKYSTEDDISEQAVQ